MVTKPNTLLANFLLRHDSDKFSLNCFNNNQNGQLIEKHKDYTD